MRADPFLQLEGKRILAIVDGQKIRGRLISARSDFLTIERAGGPRLIINRFELSSIEEETRPISRIPRLTRTFWK